MIFVCLSKGNNYFIKYTSVYVAYFIDDKRILIYNIPKFTDIKYGT